MASFEKGRYRAKIVGQGFGETKPSTPGKDPNPKFFWRIIPIGMYSIDKPGGELAECNQWERMIERVITENTVDYFVQDLEKLGCSIRSFEQLDPENEGHYSFVDLEVDVFCNHKTSNDGKTFEEWRFSFGGGGKSREVEPLDKKSLRKLDALFGQKLKAAIGKPAKANGKAKAAPVAAAAASVTEDEVPF